MSVIIRIVSPQLVMRWFISRKFNPTGGLQVLYSVPDSATNHYYVFIAAVQREWKRMPRQKIIVKKTSYAFRNGNWLETRLFIYVKEERFDY